MSRLAVVIALLVTLLPGLAAAQTYPEYSDLFVNDDAQVLTPEAATRLRAQLSRLKEETGVEATILTLPSKSPYAPGLTLEEFATGLFNHWGVGLAERNDGILVLILTLDREMRIELGSGYSQDFDTIAQDIVTRSFLPAFRDGDYARGIEEGTAEIEERIARRRVAGLAPLPFASPGFDFSKVIPMGAMALFGLVFFRRRISDLSQRFRTCPSCGRRGLGRSRSLLRSASRYATGLERVRTTCPSCSWQDERDRTVPRLSASRNRSGGSFGGGSSSGGGASGRW